MTPAQAVEAIRLRHASGPKCRCGRCYTPAMMERDVGVLLAEVKRLREALEGIGRLSCVYPDDQDDQPCPCGACSARAALEPTP